MRILATPRISLPLLDCFIVDVEKAGVLMVGGCNSGVGNTPCRGMQRVLASEVVSFTFPRLFRNPCEKMFLKLTLFPWKSS